MSICKYYYRARYYDPKLGSFISRDPIGHASNELNLSRYVKNNPIYKNDPTGLFSSSGNSPRARCRRRVLENYYKQHQKGEGISCEIDLENLMSTTCDNLSDEEDEFPSHLEDLLKNPQNEL